MGDEKKRGDELTETYLKLYNMYVELESEAAKSSVKIMVSLPSGALALTIPFVRYIAPDPTWKCMLYLGWGGFITSLVLTLVGLSLTQKAMRRQRDILAEVFKAAKKDLPNKVDQKNALNDVLTYVGFGNYTSLVFGVVAFAIFCGHNLTPLEERGMTGSEKAQSESANTQPDKMVAPSEKTVPSGGEERFLHMLAPDVPQGVFDGESAPSSGTAPSSSEDTGNASVSGSSGSEPTSGSAEAASSGGESGGDQ